LKAVILAGGLGTRLAEETDVRPKPMVEIGGYPMLWHIMKIFSTQGVNDFIICCGYRGYVIKEYFANYFLHASDVTFNLETNEQVVHRAKSEPWKVTLVDTGVDTNTGGRLKRIKDYLRGDESFYMTYGDGVGNIDLRLLHREHASAATFATVTAVRPPGRFGVLDISHHNRRVTGFSEKPLRNNSWVNGGFLLLDRQVLEYIEDDDTSFEYAVLPSLARDGQLSAYCHEGFWQPMDTLRDKTRLQELWDSGNPDWKIWMD
jgi:glucose-1-phosphate cytidylyltransferase